jgi:hypothetical protein
MSIQNRMKKKKLDEMKFKNYIKRDINKINKQSQKLNERDGEYN